MIELIVVIAILSIVAVIAYPVITGLAEKAKVAADIENLHSLNSVTSVYRAQRTASDPFEDASNSNDTLNQLLVDEGFFREKVAPEQKYMVFHWSFDQKKWMLLDLLTTDQITMGSGGFTGYLTASYQGTNSDILIPQTINGVTVNSVYQDVFSGCNLTSVTFPVNSGLRRIHARAFKDNKLTEIVFPNSLERIDYGAFLDNEIVKITIGDGVYLEGNVFQNDNKFNDAYVGKGTYSYSDDNWIKE